MIEFNKLSIINIIKLIYNFGWRLNINLSDIDNILMM